jgi:hypothetical protein
MTIFFSGLAYSPVSSSNTGISLGTITGISVGSAAGELVILGILVFAWMKGRNRSRVLRSEKRERQTSCHGWEKVEMENSEKRPSGATTGKRVQELSGQRVAALHELADTGQPV